MTFATEHQTQHDMEEEALEAWAAGVRDCITPTGLKMLLNMAVDQRLPSFSPEVVVQEVVGCILDDVIDAVNRACQAAYENGGVDKDVTDSIKLTMFNYMNLAYGELSP